MLYRRVLDILCPGSVDPSFLGPHSLALGQQLKKNYIYREVDFINIIVIVIAIRIIITITLADNGMLNVNNKNTKRR